MKTESIRLSGMVSIVMPAFNAQRFIGHAIRSVLNQTYTEFELIIVDDGSKDGTADIVESFNDPRIKFLKHPINMGIAAARNTGNYAACGEWIAPIDADDAWHESRLQRLMEVARGENGVFVGSDVMICSSGRDGSLAPLRRKIDRDNLPDFFFAAPTDYMKYGLDLKPIFPRSVVVEKAITFRQEFYGHEWLYFIMKLYSVGLKFAVVNEPLYYYRIHSDSDSNTYACIVSQLLTCDYLMSVDWIDSEVKKQIRDSVIPTRRRLFTTSIRERLWKNAIRHAMLDPGCLAYAFERILSRFFTRFR